MKKYLKSIFILLSISCSVNIYSQCPINTTTTDWREYDPNDPKKSNSFNWTNPGLVYDVYLTDNLDNPSRYIELPYFCTKSPGTGSCNNKNTLIYELLGNTAEAQKIRPEDGWELVIKDFGTKNTTTGDQTGRGASNPYFVLYNRNTGKMKIFIAIVGVQTGNAALLRVSFSTSGSPKKTALFSHAQAITKPIKSFDKTNFFNSINDWATKSQSDDYYWLVSEIQTAYDPCACQRPQNFSGASVISVEAFVITNSTINAELEGSTVQQLVSNQSVNAPQDKQLSFKDLAGKAISGYNTWNSYKNQTKSFLDNNNNEYKNELIDKWWKAQITLDPNLAGTITFDQKTTLFNEFKSSDENFKKMVGMDEIDKYNRIAGTIKGIASYFPYVGTAIGIIDYFSAAKKEETPEAPLVFNTNFKVTGTISTEIPKADFSFHNPGTIAPNDPSGSHLRPFYNNVLGVFNVLEAPTFQHFKITPIVTLDNPLTNPSQFPENDDVDALNAPLRQIKMTQDLKYIINPAANLEVEMIDACFVYEYGGSDIFISDPNDFSSSTAIPAYDFMHLTSSEKSFEERIESLEERGIYLDYISADYLSGGANSNIRLRTPYVPLKCLPNQAIVLFGGVNPKVFIKLLVKMKRTDDPTAGSLTQIITYDVSDNFNASTELSTPIKYTAHLFAVDRFQVNLITNYTNVRYNFIEINSVPVDNLYFKPHNITYNPSTMSGNIIATGDITIPNYTNVPAGTVFKAFGKIIVGGSVTFGDNVELRSAYSVSIPQNNSLNPTISIIIDPGISLTAFNCTSSDVVSLKATQPEIDAICNSQAYKTNSGQNKTDPFGFEPPKEENPITECTIYPNPAASTIYVSLGLEKETNYSTIITDINGKELLRNNSSGKIGKNVESFDISQLSPGIYFIKVNTGYYSKTDKFVILN